MHFTIEEIYEEKRKNPEISFIEILTEFQVKYSMEDDALISFIKKNKTFLNEIQRECQERRLLKKIKITSTISLDNIFGG